MIKKIKRTAGMILINSKNEVLLQLRDNKPGILFPGCYSLFGGKIEESETKEIALKREIEEEIGVKLNEFNFFKTYHYLINNEIHEINVFIVHKNLNQEDIMLREGAGFGFFSKPNIKTIRLGFNTEQILTDFFNAFETGEIK